jgi:hypothetical protein
MPSDQSFHSTLQNGWLQKQQLQATVDQVAFLWSQLFQRFGTLFFNSQEFLKASGYKRNNDGIYDTLTIKDYILPQANTATLGTSKQLSNPFIPSKVYTILSDTFLTQAVVRNSSYSRIIYSIPRVNPNRLKCYNFKRKR